MKEKHSGLTTDIVLEREIYYDNRKARLQEFRDNLREPKNEFAIAAVIVAIVEQERFIVHITKNGHRVAKAKEEEKFLIGLIEEAKTVFGKDYDRLYEETISS